MHLIAISLAGLTVAACGTSGVDPVPINHHTNVYQDRSGWSLTVPPGWHARHFSDSRNGITSTGVQLSNVKLPLPSLLPGYPIQVNGQVLPAGGIGLIIATDPDPRLHRGPLRQPPLPAPNGRYWNVGSSLPGSPYIETSWFRAHGMTLIASAKIGSHVTSQQLKTLASIISSLR